jgi:hypothetical protein
MDAPAMAAPAVEPADETGSETTVMAAPAATPTEAADGFPIEDFDRLRATELLAMLPGLDRNQLEAVRSREAAGKNRFTIMSRVDALLASKEEPAWEAADDDWEDAGTDAESEAVVIEAQALREEDGFGDELDEIELVSPSAGASDFPIAGYDTLTVGQILPRLSELDADELDQVRSRERAGRNRGTILDRVDRLSARAGGAMAMPPAATPSRARKAPAKKAPAAAATRKAATPRPSKAPALPVPAAPAVPAKAARKTPVRKAAAAPVKAARKTPARKAAAAPAPAPTPMKDAVKKARATKKTR